jgi:hypothetical protein
MYLRQAKNLLAVSVLWLAVGVGCKNDEPYACPDGNCCSPGTQAKFFKRIEGWRADYGGLSFGFKDTLNIVNGFVLHGAAVCDVQEDMINAMQLKSNATIENGKFRLIDSTNRYRYRVWGIIYELPQIINFLPIPTYRIRVEKVESVY